MITLFLPLILNIIYDQYFRDLMDEMITEH